MSMKPYTLDEVRALPEGAKVWAEEQPESGSPSQWHAVKHINTLFGDNDTTLEDAKGWQYSANLLSDDTKMLETVPQFWSSQPSDEDKAAAKWEVGT